MRADNLQHIRHCHHIRRPRRHDAVQVTVHLGENAAFGQAIHKLIQPFRWGTGLLGEVIHRRWFRAAQEMLAGNQHNPTRDEFPAAMVDAFARALLQVGADVLRGVRDLRPEQHNEP